MKKLFLPLVFLSVSQVTSAQIEPPLNSPERLGKIFSLNIAMSFNGELEFTLHRNKSGASVELNGEIIKHGINGRESQEKILNRRKNISKSQENEIVSLLNKIMKTYTLDDVGGLDGSNWCLNLNGYATKVKMCFWSPDHRSEERGLVALHQLGQYLAKIHNVDVY